MDGLLGVIRRQATRLQDVADDIEAEVNRDCPRAIKTTGHREHAGQL
ncbi:hypothetical protein [Streptomyces sp. 1222.5]